MIPTYTYFKKLKKMSIYEGRQKSNKIVNGWNHQTKDKMEGQRKAKRRVAHMNQKGES
jgi:hypothetical protein